MNGIDVDRNEEYRGHWVLVSTIDGLEPIRYSEHFAQLELESMLDEWPTGIAINLHDHVAAAEWKRGTDGNWESFNSDRAKLLANCINEPSIDDDQLFRRVCGHSQSRDNFRQIRRRTKTALQNLLGDHSLQVFDQNRIDLPVPVFAILNGNHLRPR